MSKYNIEALLHEIYRSPHKINLKHDIVCRKIAKDIKADSVSILLYNGAENKLICKGRYIDPDNEKANAIPLDSMMSPKVIKVMEHIDVWEFFKMRKGTPNAEMFGEYYKNICCDKTVINKKNMFALINESEGIEAIYKSYKGCFTKERHPVGLTSTISGLYYYILHHYDNHHINLQEFNDSFKKGGGDIFPKTKICISNLSVKPDVLNICRNHLTESLKIKIEDGGYYVGIPITAPDDRLIGVLRIILGNNLIKLISKLGFRSIRKMEFCEDGDPLICKIHSYLVDKFNIERIASIIGAELNYHELLESFDKISLKPNLNQEFVDYNKLADELAAVINCFGCVIRTSLGNHDAKILGYSNSVDDYISDLTFDPYISEDKFKTPLIDLFYNTNENIDSQNYSIKEEIISIQVELLPNRSCTISYQYINEKLELISTKSWSDRLKNIELDLKELFIISFDTFSKYDIREVVIIPIKEIKYGFITLANKSVHPFAKRDFKMIIPVVRRVGFEYKQKNDHLQDKERLKQETLIHSTRIMFHQLGSPITSLRNHIQNIRQKLIPEEKIALRLQEMEFTYQDFLDMLSTNQFFFEYATKGTVKLDYTDFNLYDFVKERIRTYQMRAKKDRGLDISVDKEGSSKYGAISDKRLIGHIIQSLIDNAIKYSFTQDQREEFLNQSGLSTYDVPKWIIVNVKNTSADFSISVTNWGCTIQPDEIDKIKTLETRGKHANAYASVGSGIGLYVVNLIVENILGGKLIIKHSLENHKTEITVTFNKEIHE